MAFGFLKRRRRRGRRSRFLSRIRRRQRIRARRIRSRRLRLRRVGYRM